MSRVHDRLKHKGPARRPARARPSAVPSVLVSDTGQAEQGGHDVRQVLHAIRDTEARLKRGILRLQKENERLLLENRELHKRLGEERTGDLT